jgi:uncharacterized Ntn-hydrolase superfamily protein
VRGRLAGWVGTTLLLAPSLARATYSITAVETSTRAVGGAGASCVPYEVDRIYSAVPGVGALNAQAYFDEEAKAEAVRLLETGLDPSAIVAEISDAQAFPLAPRMQWGIVDVEGNVATFTGPEAMAFAGDRHVIGAESDGYSASVQGNVLTSVRVLERMEIAFSESGCDLADRLMLGLEAASSEGEGDSRCTPEGRPANSAYLDVTWTDGTRLHLSVPDVSPADPIAALRASYDRFRVDNPCPAPAPHAQGNPSTCTVAPGRASRAWPLLLGLLLVVGWRSRLAALRAQRVVTIPSSPSTTPKGPPLPSVSTSTVFPANFAASSPAMPRRKRSTRSLPSSSSKRTSTVP